MLLNHVPIAVVARLHDTSVKQIRDIYHHVLARCASPEAAKVEISTARNDGRLTLYAEQREHKAQPDLRSKSGLSPPQLKPEVILDCPVPCDGLRHWDWERGYATRRDGITKSLFEYVNIVARHGDVLRLWPVLSRGVVPAVVQQLNVIEHERVTGLAGLRQKELLEMVSTRLGRRVSLRSLQSAVSIRRRKSS